MYTIFNNLAGRCDDYTTTELFIWKNIQLSERQHHDELWKKTETKLSVNITSWLSTSLLRSPCSRERARWRPFPWNVTWRVPYESTEFGIQRISEVHISILKVVTLMLNTFVFSFSRAKLPPCAALSNLLHITYRDQRWSWRELSPEWGRSSSFVYNSFLFDNQVNINVKSDVCCSTAGANVPCGNYILNSEQRHDGYESEAVRDILAVSSCMKLLDHI